MQSELKEFLSTFLPIRRWGQRVKGLFVRNRVAPEAKVFASYLYAQGSSLRRLKELLRDFGVRVSHVGIWKWIQRLGRSLKGKLFKRKRRRCLVVNETKIHTQKGWIFVFAAVDPENRELVNLLVTEHRETVDALGFLKRCLRYCKGKPIIATDGGPWYRWPTRRLGLKHAVLCGGERNYIERWFETKIVCENSIVISPPAASKASRTSVRCFVSGTTSVENTCHLEGRRPAAKEALRCGRRC